MLPLTNQCAEELAETVMELVSVRLHQNWVLAHRKQLKEETRVADEQETALRRDIQAWALSYRRTAQSGPGIDLAETLANVAFTATIAELVKLTEDICQIEANAPGLSSLVFGGTDAN